jgi:hypothetical protein
MEKFGSGIHIPDPLHWILARILQSASPGWTTADVTARVRKFQINCGDATIEVRFFVSVSIFSFLWRTVRIETCVLCGGGGGLHIICLYADLVADCCWSAARPQDKNPLHVHLPKRIPRHRS